MQLARPVRNHIGTFHTVAATRAWQPTERIHLCFRESMGYDRSTSEITFLVSSLELFAQLPGTLHWFLLPRFSTFERVEQARVDTTPRCDTLGGFKVTRLGLLAAIVTTLAIMSACHEDTWHWLTPIPPLPSVQPDMSPEPSLLPTITPEASYPCYRWRAMNCELTMKVGEL